MTSNSRLKRARRRIRRLAGSKKENASSNEKTKKLRRAETDLVRDEMALDVNGDS
jgi:hypothetical protein